MTRVNNGYLLDEYVTLLNVNLVFDDNNEPYSCILNETDISSNANKFYRMQILTDGKAYYLYKRYGRIGVKGVVDTSTSIYLDSCITLFKKIFKDKTKNKWEDRHNFKKVDKCYFFTQSCEKIVDEPPKSLSLVSKPSPFHADVNKFLNLISSKEMIKTSFINLDIDLKKLPLGKISNSQILKAKDLLINLQQNLKKTSGEKIMNISSEYYTYIPHSFGLRETPPVIDSVEKISYHLEKLEELEKISFNVDFVQESMETIDPIQSLYDSLGVEMIHMPVESDIYGLIEKYITNSHGKSHHFKLNLVSVLKIHRPSFHKAYSDKFSGFANKELLIHGSGLSNWVSILKKGLLLDPSKIGAVITGKMFGYGIYWANSFSKSAQYCGHSRSSKTELVCFTLGEVALGNQLMLKASDPYLNYANMRKRGDFDSVYAQGKISTDEFAFYENYNIPIGKMKSIDDPSRVLIYDEKIVYDANQFDLKYMVIAEMTY